MASTFAGLRQDSMLSTVNDLVVYVDVDDTLLRFAGPKSIPIPASIEHVRALQPEVFQVS